MLLMRDVMPGKTPPPLLAAHLLATTIEPANVVDPEVVSA